MIELLVVLTIMAGIAALASPSMSNTLAQRRVAVATSELVSGLRAARGRAMSGQAPVAVVIDVAEGSFSVENRIRSLSLPHGAQLGLVSAKSEQLSDTRGGILFFADGSSTGGTVTVKYRAVTRAIEIDWVTGLVRISS